MLRPRALVMLVATAVLLGGGGYLAFTPAAVSAPAALPPARERAVATVRAALPPGHILRPDDLAPLAWPGATLPAGAVLDGTPEAVRLAGAVTRRALATGEIVMPGATIAPGERGFLAAIVAPGKRAMAVPVEAATAAGGLIWPGDRVDLILTQEIREEGVPLAARVVSETILANARVLSTDQRLDTAAQGGTIDAAAPPRVPATLTIEVTPGEAERVTVAATLGKLHLTLRGIEASAAVTAPTPATWAGGVSPALVGLRPRRAAAASAPSAAAPVAVVPRGVRVLRGTQGAA